MSRMGHFSVFRSVLVALILLTVTPAQAVITGIANHPGCLIGIEEADSELYIKNKEAGDSTHYVKDGWWGARLTGIGFWGSTDENFGMTPTVINGTKWVVATGSGTDPDPGTHQGWLYVDNDSGQGSGSPGARDNGTRRASRPHFWNSATSSRSGCWPLARLPRGRLDRDGLAMSPHRKRRPGAQGDEPCATRPV